VRIVNIRTDPYDVLIGRPSKWGNPFVIGRGGHTHDGYMPDDVDLGGGDYVRFTVCLNCGQVQGEWPLPPAISMGEGE
jgi:hypothetical protein